MELLFTQHALQSVIHTAQCCYCTLHSAVIAHCTALLLHTAQCCYCTLHGAVISHCTALLLHTAQCCYCTLHSAVIAQCDSTKDHNPGPEVLLGSLLTATETVFFLPCVPHQYVSTLPTVAHRSSPPLQSPAAVLHWQLCCARCDYLCSPSYSTQAGHS